MCKVGFVWVRLGLAGMACLAVAGFGGDWHGRRGSVWLVKVRYVRVRFGQAGVVRCGAVGYDRVGRGRRGLFFDILVDTTTIVVLYCSHRQTKGARHD